MVWHGDLEIRDGIALRNRHGIGFLIIVQAPLLSEPTVRPNDDSDDEGTLLQTYSKSVPVDHRRLTTGLVAHTQWPEDPPAAKLISLEEALPAAPEVRIDFSAVECLAYDINFAAHEFCQAWPEGLILPEATLAAYDNLIPISQLQPTAFHFYTDGSKVPHGVVGAGIVLLVEYSGGLAFGGALCKTVYDIGHAGLGENGAVVWALLRAIQLSNHFWAISELLDVHFHFHFDSINAGFLAGGYYRTKRYPEFRIAIRSLAHAFQGRHDLSRLHWHHVKAHSAHPWTEVADAAASTHPDRAGSSAMWLPWLSDQRTLLGTDDDLQQCSTPLQEWLHDLQHQSSS